MYVIKQLSMLSINWLIMLVSVPIIFSLFAACPANGPIAKVQVRQWSVGWCGRPHPSRRGRCLLMLRSAIISINFNIFIIIIPQDH